LDGRKNRTREWYPGFSGEAQVFYVGPIARRDILEEELKNFVVGQSDFLETDISEEECITTIRYIHTLNRAGMQTRYVFWSTVESIPTSSSSRKSMTANFILLGRACHEAESTAELWVSMAKDEERSNTRIEAYMTNIHSGLASSTSARHESGWN